MVKIHIISNILERICNRIDYWTMSEYNQTRLRNAKAKMQKNKNDKESETMKTVRNSAVVLVMPVTVSNQRLT